MTLPYVEHLAVHGVRTEAGEYHSRLFYFYERTKKKRKEESVVTEKKQRHPNSLKNLKYFQPGQSGNPEGRPKSKPFTDALLKILRENPLEAEKIARAMLKKSRAGSVKHFTAVADRIEGRPLQTIEGTGEGGAVELIVRNVGRGHQSEDT